MTEAEFESAVAECVQIASRAERHFTAAFDYVRRLIIERGWNEADARRVGTRAIGMLDGQGSPSFRSASLGATEQQP